LVDVVREQLFSRLLHHPTHISSSSGRDRTPLIMIVSNKPCCESGSGISSEFGSVSRVLMTKSLRKKIQLKFLKYLFVIKNAISLSLALH
jgi:hypothetical protein